MRTLNDDISEVTDELERHFGESGPRSPVFVGGDNYAYCIAGIEKSQVLIVDPHYTGSDDPKSIVKGLSWKNIRDIGNKNNFYNFCFMKTSL